MQGISWERRGAQGAFLLMDNRTGGIKAAIGEESTSREDLIVFCQKAAWICFKTTYRLCTSTRNEKV